MPSDNLPPGGAEPDKLDLESLSLEELATLSILAELYLRELKAAAEANRAE